MKSFGLKDIRWQPWQKNENNFHVFIAALEAIDKQYTSYINERVSIYGNKNKLQVTVFNFTRLYKISKYEEILT